jgi:hypothetical protein
MSTYQLKVPIVGVVRSISGMVITQFAPGEILTVPDGVQEKGMVEILHQGRIVSVFIEDLLERAESLEAKTNVRSQFSRREAC